MKKHWAISLALFFFVFLPIATLGLVFMTTPVTASCQSCQAKSQSATTVSYAELLRDAERYRGQTIRVEALVDHDAGYTSLRNPANLDWKQAIPVGFGSSYFDCPATRKALAFNTGLGTWYDGIAPIVVIGVYGQIDDQRKFRDQQIGLTLLCIEEVNPFDPWRSVPVNLLRYTMGKVGRLLFLFAKN